MSACIDFVGAAADGSALRHAFGKPLQRLVAHTAAEVPPLLDRAHRLALQGRWCVGFVRYEAAAAFDPACRTHEADGPLAWFAVYDEPVAWPCELAAPQAPLHWQAGLQRRAFDTAVRRIHQAITEGEVYQVNLTAPWHGRFDGEPLALFQALHRAQPQAYAAFVDAGDEQVLSVSPELFFDWRDGRLLSRPMKGTAPRGATPQEDEAMAAGLLASEKERAENLMIVDLIRNDLSRVAQPFSVQVPQLFERRAWPTVWQMTSDVTARTREGTTLAQVFGALFPCGSITGAPKLRAMHWIRQLEAQPRGVYCGAIGVLQPGGAATFSVGIRTVVLRGGNARCGIGSGITIDAHADAEWREWQHKAAFLQRASHSFELLQTLRLEQGHYPALALHLARLADAARHFGRPFDAAAARQALQQLAQQHACGTWRVRLLVDGHGQARIQAFALGVTGQPVRVQLAASPVVAPQDFLRFKTTRREHYEAHAPADAAVFDTLLWNADREVTEFTRGNVLAQLDDGRWITPPLRCGLLDGVGRALALQHGRATEAVLRVDELPRVRELRFVNALRGELRTILID
ncbi:aminodeoxychorismate synthase component I [Ideonella sp. BN130291]|nr:aminodeoxychorismate synthase component I [Ideonella sp. BN130291]